MLILNKLNWRIFLENPFEFIYLILSELSKKFNCNEKQSNEIFNSIVDLLSFCFSELSIYINYNQFEISITCILLVLEIYFEENLLGEFKDSIIDLINCEIALNNIHNCKLIIQNKFIGDVNHNNNQVNYYEYAKGQGEELTINKFDNDLIYSGNISNFSTIDLDEDKDTNYNLISQVNCNDFVIEIDEDDF
jgi:hypothetical protein